MAPESICQECGVKLFSPTKNGLLEKEKEHHDQSKVPMGSSTAHICRNFKELEIEGRATAIEQRSYICGRLTITDKHP